MPTEEGTTKHLSRITTLFGADCLSKASFALVLLADATTTATYLFVITDGRTDGT
jgi:hypothetical protein